MYKAIMINLQDKYPVHELLEKKFFEIIFKNNIDEIKNELADKEIILYYSPELDFATIEKLRESCKFKNIKIVHFTDNEINHEDTAEMQLRGADLVEKLPEDTNTLMEHLHNLRAELETSNDFDDKALEPFKLALTEIFSTMAYLDVSIDNVYYAPGIFHLGELSGIMNLSGHEEGHIIISMKETLAQKVISNIMAIPSNELTQQDVEDGLEELINMTAGGAKARLGDEDDHFELSSPRIISEKDKEFCESNENCIVITCKVDDDCFAIKLCLPSLVN